MSSGISAVFRLHPDLTVITAEFGRQDYLRQDKAVSLSRSTVTGKDRTSNALGVLTDRTWFRHCVLGGCPVSGDSRGESTK